MATSTTVGIRELLEAGVHFGHQTRRWNPKMRRFIHGEREGIYIIDLLQTEELLHRATEFAAGIARRGGTILFVGTKKQARDAVQEVAESCGMPYIQNRWLGGVLTNFQTINQRIKRLHDLERFETDGSLALLPTQERMAAQADLAKLRANLGGVKNMQRTPDAIFIVDLKTEAIAVREAQRLRIPIIGLVDTNCDPDGIDYVIPGNDDAIRSCSLILRAIGDRINEGRSVWQQAEQERLQREAEEAARREAERAAAEEARREAEEQAAREAAERIEDRQAEAAATPKANRPTEGSAPEGPAKPHPAPTVSEDLPPRPTGGRGKRKKAQAGPGGEDPSGAKGAGATPDAGASKPAKSAAKVAPAKADETTVTETTPDAIAGETGATGARQTDPGSSDSPGADAAAAAEEVRQADEAGAGKEATPARDAAVEANADAAGGDEPAADKS